MVEASLSCFQIEIDDFMMNSDGFWAYLYYIITVSETMFEYM